MKLKNTIFDSKSEKGVFKSLQSRWSSKLVLYPQLPLSKIIELHPEELAPAEKNFFYKTNVDYTFCEKSGRPILSIEFDGIGGGFSKDGVYLQVREAPDARRKKKMDFKLRLANAVSYPLVIVSYEEIESIDQQDSFTILDGIIGQYLAKIETVKLLEEWWKENKDWI